MMQLALILTLLVFSVSAGACPKMCTCKNYPTDKPQIPLYYTHVSCDSYLENATFSLDSTTRDFQISNMNREQVEAALDGLADNESNLQNLAIINSDMGNVSAGIFDRILSLAVVDSHLSYVPVLSSNISKLQTLDLSRNEIAVIYRDSFELLPALEVLNLSSNALIILTAESLNGLALLKCLDLSRNKLNKLEDQLLQPLKSLQYLNLSTNRLESLNEVSFSSLIMLQQLDVSWNRLARVAPGSLHLPSLARLLLAGNSQLGRSREASVLVGTGRKLQMVDASRTGLKQVPAALTHSIRTLRLANNSIRSVNCGDLDSYPLVQLLDFTSNQLGAIEEDALGRLDSLSLLYLTDNKIRNVPKSLPEKLSVLHLEHNEIESVSKRDFQGLAILEVLLLNDNKIRIVEEAAFGQLVSLVTLDLSRNPITVLQPGCLSGPAGLQALRISSIGIIPPAEEVSFPLSTTEHLITLDLSDSPGLARQFLADTAALAASRELQELDLSKTDLHFIRSDLLHYLPQLRLLHIRDNRLNCSELQWLAVWLRRQDEAEYRDVVCASPPDLWGLPLVDLQDVVEISTARIINHQQESSINLSSQQNNTNIFQITGNSTGQYTTEAINQEESSEKNLETGKIRGQKMLSLKTAIIYQSKYKKKNKISLESNNKNEVLMTEEGIRTMNASFERLTTASSLNNEDSSRWWRIISTRAPVSHSPERDSTITQAGKVAITVTTIPLKQTVAAATDPPIATLALENGNETTKSRHNEPDQSRFISETSRNLFVNQEGPSTSASTDVGRALEEPIDRTENSSQGEMSMFTNSKDNSDFLLHPGMLILAASIMGAAAALAMLTARLTRKRRNNVIFRNEEIEVNSLPSVTELW